MKVSIECQSNYVYLTNKFKTPISSFSNIDLVQNNADMA